MVRWSDQARADLKAIHKYIARDSTHYAKKITQELVDKADEVVDLPRLGRVVPELGYALVREVPAHSYRILYEIKHNDDIVILAVIYKRRDLRQGEVP